MAKTTTKMKEASTKKAKAPAVDYATTTTPKDYKCKHCGAKGCKLWREYQTMMPQLLCADCAVKNQKKNYVVEEDGTHKSEHHSGTSDQIGWYVPAVPTDDGYGYWGYTSVPDAGVQWWNRLPLRNPAKSAASPAKASKTS